MNAKTQARLIAALTTGVAGGILLSPPDSVSHLITGLVMALITFLLISVLLLFFFAREWSTKSQTVAAYATGGAVLLSGLVHLTLRLG